jgi:ribosomal protein S18 acetylase RimI-like enzyme
MYGKRYADIEEFYTLCYHFLAEHEAENNLIFGILETLRTNIYAYDPTFAPEFVAIFDNKDIVLVSIRTPPYNQLISYTKKKDSIPVLVDFLAETGVDIPGVLGFKDGALLFAELWAKRHEKNKILNMNERMYKLDQVNPQTIGKNIFEVATDEHLDLLIHYAQNFAQEVFANTSQDQIARNQVQLTKGMEKWITEKIIYILKVHNQIVSIAKASRDTPNGRSITLVYTPPKYRRKGYATELVAKLCQSILDEGKKYCFLFTDLTNPTSNKIYMDVGFNPIMDVDEYRFE